MIIEKLLLLLEKNISNAISLLALLPSMSDEEQYLANSFIEDVVANTSLLDLKEKEALNYMKLYLKTRKETTTELEDMISEEQQRRLKQLST